MKQVPGRRGVAAAVVVVAAIAAGGIAYASIRTRTGLFTAATRTRTASLRVIDSAAGRAVR